jgi:hypothetical protein
MTITIASDLRDNFGDVRDQHARPTCLAFATSDLHAASRALPFIPLSVEYLYFHAVQRSVRPNPKKGVTLNAVADALKTVGQPLETAWPYSPTLPTDLSKWRPPKGVEVFRQALCTRRNLAAAILSVIDNKQPVLVCLKISEAFYRPNGSGVVANIKNDRDTGYHAVLAIGHGTIAGDSIILVRNSWGEDWGLGGHAWLHSDYLSQRLCSLSIIPYKTE